MTPRDRARAKVAQAFRERIERALAFNAAEQLGFRPPTDPHAFDGLVSHVVDEVEAVLSAYRYPLTRHTAMAVRLAAQWHPLIGASKDAHGPWGLDQSRAPDDTTARWEGGWTILEIERTAERSGVMPERVTWPSNVSFDDVRRTIERSKDPDAQVVARSMRDGKWKVAGPDPRGGIHELYDHSIVLRPECYAPLPTNPDLAIIADPDLRLSLIHI